MGFIARSSILILFLLVAFALFEVRYDTLRRRDEGRASVIRQSTASFQV